MKWIKSNGRKLVVRDVSVSIMELVADEVPLPIEDMIYSDDEARAHLRGLLDTKRYRRVQLTASPGLPPEMAVEEAKQSPGHKKTTRKRGA